ncbi:MAG: hypothetical protein PCFJNLEI_01293 [Verrucomicrobiae bacterium]|nr:hypothetical protein [Verrucomicrobiae bacterium]
MKNPLGFLCLLLLSGSVHADVKLPGVFSDHMVLQRDQPVPVWGTANPGERVTVKFRTQTKFAVADATGKWQVKLEPLKAGGPDKLIVNSIEFDDVLVGEVWVGSGQSNMGATVRWAISQNDTGMMTLVAAGPYPQIREFGVAGLLQSHVPGRWRIADTNAVQTFSALQFAFGVRLQKELKVPIGLIIGSVSGSPSGAWLSRDMLKSAADCQAVIQEFAKKFDTAAELKAYASVHAKWQQAVAEAKAQKKPEPQAPCPPRSPGEVNCGKVGTHFETYIRPVIPHGIRGVLWDQGESGTAIIGLPDQGLLMGALIRGWRRDWGQDDFPFIYVQKPSGGGCAWDYTNPVTRRADPFSALPAAVNGDPIAGGAAPFLKIMKYPNTAMVIASDLGAGQGNHPDNKSGYGHRAADVALGMTYRKPIEYYGPVYESHTVTGAVVRVKFNHIGQGLAFRHGDKLQGFALAGTDKIFHWADATIDGDAVVLTSAKVTQPVAVSYAWARDRTWANLFNQDGLPALPFHTEH